MLMAVTFVPVFAQENPEEKVLAFELKDTTGQVVKLEEFAGKLLVIDFWFTGCKGCVHVAKGLHGSIMPEFSADSSVVFISVCLDINFLQWKKSLKTDLYSSKEQINLFTMGMGTAHPLFKCYGYSGCPQLLLIDKKGKLIDDFPPMPVAGAAPANRELISLIKNNL